MTKPEWIKPTPRELYAKGVRDASVYISVGKELILPETFKHRDFGFWAGMIAQYYGVNLRPNGKD